MAPLWNDFLRIMGDWKVVPRLRDRFIYFVMSFRLSLLFWNSVSIQLKNVRFFSKFDNFYGLREITYCCNKSIVLKTDC